MPSREIRRVEWLDSAGGSGWTNEEIVAKSHIAHCETVGFVIKDDDEELVLAMSADSDNSVADHWICIPYFAITKMVTLRKARA